MKATTLKLTVDTSDLDVALAKAKELEATLARIAALRKVAPVYPTWPYYQPYWNTTTGVMPASGTYSAK